MSGAEGLRRRVEVLEADQAPALRTWADLVVYEAEHPGEGLPPNAPAWMLELERKAREDP